MAAHLSLVTNDETAHELATPKPGMIGPEATELLGQGHVAGSVVVAGLGPRLTDDENQRKAS